MHKLTQASFYILWNSCLCSPCLTQPLPVQNVFFLSLFFLQTFIAPAQKGCPNVKCIMNKHLNYLIEQEFNLSY